MATQSPFSLLEKFLQTSPPQFAAPSLGGQRNSTVVILLLNHVLMQESEATTRLARQKGQVMLVQWRSFSFRL
jgi:ubiquinone biosynthesis protein UbiJ